MTIQYDNTGSVNPQKVRITPLSQQLISEDGAPDEPVAMQASVLTVYDDDDVNRVNSIKIPFHGQFISVSTLYECCRHAE